MLKNYPDESVWRISGSNRFGKEMVSSLSLGNQYKQFQSDKVSKFQRIKAMILCHSDALILLFTLRH